MEIWIWAVSSKRRMQMATPEILQKHGYESLYLSQRFDLWERDDKKRLYAMVYDPPTTGEVEDALKEVRKALGGHTPFDLITDHTTMTRVERTPPEDLSVCFDRLFDEFEIRYVVRVCQTDRCGLCLDLDTELPRKGKGRLLGRAPNFEAAEGLLDNQGGE
jgi:hypothetical protein